jgi:hypothetical protein
MKRNYHFRLIIIVISLLNFAVVFSQNSEASKYRTLVKKTLNGYYLDDSEKTFNAYTEYDNLNFDLNYKLDLSMSEIREINEPQILEDKSKEMAYTIISEISQSVILGQINESKYENVVLNIQYKTKDYKYIKHSYSIDVQYLLSLSQNMNRNGFYRILEKK